MSWAREGVREDLLEMAVSLLHHFHVNPRPALPLNLSIRRVGESETWLVEAGSVYHLVWCNGGEAGVEVLNSGHIPRFVEYLRGFGPGAALTLAGWVAALIRGEAPDYKTVWTDADAADLVGEGGP